MVSLVWIVAIVVFIFLITYNPSSGTLNKVIGRSNSPSGAGPMGCANDTYRAQNPQKCEDPHYNGLQFADPAYATPAGPDRTAMGAIIR